MVIVVQLFAADEDAPGHDVRARVGDVVAAVAEVVTDAVDHSRGPEWNPGDLRQPDECPWNGAECHDIGEQHQQDAGHGVARVDVTLHPIVRRAMPVTLEDRKSTRLNSSHMSISYAVFCLKKK